MAFTYFTFSNLLSEAHAESMTEVDQSLNSSPNSLNIRRHDINGPICQQIVVELWAEIGHLATNMRPFPPEARPSVLPSGSIFLVAETVADGRPLACPDLPYPSVAGSLALVPLELGARTANGLRQDGKTAEVKRVITRLGQRRRGVAGRLLEAIEDIARTELGLEVLVLETNQAMVDAQKMYERYGWKRREVYGWYNSDESVCYEKHL
ncbi:hypothetical protein LTR10_013849 [Elasticomyces elasticus]|nr:hypothetical protein LTR10_013849 [Elasticomyces elasticus]KAK4974568.1 hypothetical protein LTR42_005213 [Elasticomyces elasticus]